MHVRRTDHIAPIALVVSLIIGSIAQIAIPSSASAAPGTAVSDIEDPRLAPGLSRVAVDSVEYRRAVSSYLDANARLDDARSRYQANQDQLAELIAAQSRLTEQVNEATRRHDKSSRLVASMQDSLRELAVTNYIRGGTSGSTHTGLELGAATDVRRERVMLEAVNVSQISQVRENKDVISRTEAVLGSAGAELDELRVRVSDVTAARDQALADGARATQDIETMSKDLSDARLEAQVVGLGTGEGSEAGIGFQLAALNAYVKAATTVASERPRCGIRWQMIAGISRVEAAHGTYLGRHIQADGEVSEPIIGIALDGNNNTARIMDTDGGEIDTDPVFDRAVGPLAFIPLGWRAYGRDGNDDGKIDVQNINDGALATATLLCSHGLDLGTDTGLRRAVFSYNHSDVYVDMVTGFVERYDAFEIPPPQR